MEQWKSLNLPILKGQCHKIFDFNFFASNPSFGPTEWYLRMILISFVIWGRYSRNKFFLHCGTHCGAIFHGVSHNAEQLSTLWDTPRSNFLHGGTHRGASFPEIGFFHIVGHTGGHFSAVCPTMWKNVLAVGDTPRNIFPRCVPQRGKMAHPTQPSPCFVNISLKRHERP